VDQVRLNIWLGPGITSNHTKWPLRTSKRWERGCGGGGGDRGLDQGEERLWAEGVRSLSTFPSPHHVSRRTADTSATAATIVSLRET